MNRRMSIPTKLALAALPLVIAIVGLLALNVRASLDDAARERRTASIVAVWEPLTVAIDAVDAEGEPFEQPLVAGSGVPAAAVSPTARAATDASIVALRAALEDLDSPPQLVRQVERVAADLAAARTAASQQRSETSAEYQQVELGLGRVGALLPTEASAEGLGRDLEALGSLLAAKQGVDRVSEIIRPAVRGAAIEPVSFERLVEDNRSAIAGFEAAAPTTWLEEWQASGVPDVVARSESTYLALIALPADQLAGELVRTDLGDYRQSVRRIGILFDGFTTSILDDAQGREADANRASLVKILVSSLAVLVALLTAWRITRSITSRIRKVSDRAHEVAVEQLPALVAALRDPKGKTALPPATPIIGAGHDEVGELAESFTAVQRTLVDVAAEQMQVMRRGVSDIFVTLARRNRTLVDRQLTLLDTLESEVDDPRTLSDYYKLDHLATRMRRNAENLLVLAGSESRHRRHSALAIDEVVRAAISEVEDYRRIDVAVMDPLTLRGDVVADLAHMLAELLDNAAAFSPPDTDVRISGRATPGGYALTIADHGVGIGSERLTELNDLLANPPIIGLSVEPTLGLSVVSLLAAKHGITVRLAPATPGTTVEVLLAPTLREGHDRDAPPEVASDEPVAPRAVDGAVVDHVLEQPEPTPAPAAPAVSPPPVAPHEPAPAHEPAAPVAVDRDLVLPRRTPAPAAPPTAPAPSGHLPAGAADAPTAAEATRPPAAASMPSIALPDLRVPTLPTRAGAGTAPPSMSLSGLPVRVPGSAKPDVDADERPVAASRPEQVRSTLAAFTSGRATAITGSLPVIKLRLPDAPAARTEPDGASADTSGGDRT